MNPTQFSTDSANPLICPSCHQKIVQAAGVTPGHSGTIRKNQIFICASCGNASIVGDSNLENLTKSKFDALPTNVKQAISGVVRTLQDMSTKTTDLN